MADEPFRQRQELTAKSLNELHAQATISDPVVGQFRASTFKPQTPPRRGGKLTWSRGVVKYCDPAVWANDDNFLDPGTVEYWPFSYPNEWENNQAYNAGDIVLVTPNPWDSGHGTYNVGDYVLYETTYYKCNTQHVAGATFEEDSDKWDAEAQAILIYQCNQNHTSIVEPSTFWDDNLTRWDELANKDPWYIDRSGATKTASWYFTFDLVEGSRIDVLNNEVVNATCKAMTGWA